MHIYNERQCFPLAPDPRHGRCAIHDWTGRRICRCKFLGTFLFFFSSSIQPFYLGGSYFQVIDTLLDTKKTPRKPQYLLASEIPLVLRTCEFENVNFICSSGNEMSFARDILELSFRKANDNSKSLFFFCLKGAAESLRSHFKKESLTYQLESVIFQEALRNCLPIGNGTYPPLPLVVT